jgi:hypothetical protein
LRESVQSTVPEWNVTPSNGRGPACTSPALPGSNVFTPAVDLTIPDACPDTDRGRGITWGVAQRAERGKPLHIIRFDVDLQAWRA